MIDRLVSDVVSALRSLRAAPAIPMAAVLTTSLAVAMNLAMAGLIDRALLSPPEFVVEPQQVFTVGFEVSSPSREKGVTATASYLTFEAVRDRVTSVTAAAWHHAGTSIGVGDSHVPVKATGVTGAYFNMLGARAAVIRNGLPTRERRARADGSFASANDPRVRVGLGPSTEPPRVRVTWPDGRVEEWASVPIDRYTTLVEGSRK